MVGEDYMSEILSIQRVTKGDITAYLPELACLRIWVFREYPYLYEGSTAYEENTFRPTLMRPAA